jgi:kinesin family protein 2/24
MLNENGHGVVGSWLANAGLKHHASKFQGVEPEVFRSLLMQDYSKYGVTSLEDKQKLFRLVKSLQMPPSSDVQLLGKKQASNEQRRLSEDLPAPPASQEIRGGAGAGLLDLEAEDELLGDFQPEEGNDFVCTTSPEAPPRQSSRSEWGRERETKAAAPAAHGKKGSAHSKRPQKIKVCVRKRPLNKRERDRRDDDIMEVHNNQRSLTVHEPKQKVDLTKYTERHELHFDHVFDVNTSNDAIYDTTIAPMLPVIYAGGRASCFAFGQTGSGKTYTMNPLPPRAAADLFDYVAGQEDMEITVSVYEIYGSKIFDLLNARNSIVIREDGKKNVNVVGLQEKKVKAIEEVEAYLAHAASVRSTGCTGANSESSRSHCITNYTLRAAPVENKRGGFRSNRGPPPEFGKVIGKISFIDLAGSERGADTYDNNKQTRMEGAQINKSLLALKECIRALDQDAKHIPFRGSKLTEVLRESFTGHSVSVMIANISPSTSCCENSLNTLRYADRVKEMKRDRSSGMPPAPEPRANVRRYSNADARMPKQVLSSSGQSVPNGFSARQEAEPKQNKRISNSVQRESNKENCLSSDNNSNRKKSVSSAEKAGYEEEVVIAAHKQLIEETMEFVRREMALLADVDQPGSSIESYVGDLRHLLSKRIAGISSFEKKLASFESSLRAD